MTTQFYSSKMSQSMDIQSILKIANQLKQEMAEMSGKSSEEHQKNVNKLLKQFEYDKEDQEEIFGDEYRKYDIKINLKQRDINRLCATIDGKIEEINSSKQLIAEKEKENKVLQNRLKNKCDEIDRLQNEITAKANSEKEALTKTLESENRTAEKLSGQLETANTNYRNLQTDVNNALNENCNLQKDIDKQKTINRNQQYNNQKSEYSFLNSD